VNIRAITNQNQYVLQREFLILFMLPSASLEKSCRKTRDVSLANTSMTVGNITYNAGGKRGATLWQMQFIAHVAGTVTPPANPDRFMFVGFQEGDIVLGILPDASDWKRTPEILAKALQAALENPENSLRAYDPSVKV